MADIDWEEDDQYQLDVEQAKKEIAAYIDNVTICTVGAIKRRFEEHTHLIQDVLHDLKMDGKIDFSEYSPAPTLITAQAMRRVKDIHYDKNNMTPAPPSKRIDVPNESLYTQKGERQ